VFEALKQSAIQLAADRMLKPYGLELKHFVPGRLRVAMPNWKSREREVRRLMEEMEQDPDVNYVEFTEITGSLLIEYNKEATLDKAILTRWKGIISKYM